MTATMKKVFSHLSKTFHASGVPEPKLSSAFILEKALERPALSIKKLTNHRVSQYHYKIVEKLATRRLMHEPIQYILGEWSFRGLTLELRKPVFIPRPETEQLVDLALELWPENSKDRLHFCEVGPGSGAITLSLLKEVPDSDAVVCDVSLSALNLTARNFHRNFGKDVKIEDRLKLIHANYSQFTDQNVTKFDFIISNPPYIPTAKYEKLEKQVKLFEDRRALDGGKYGLDVIWELIRRSSDELKVGGFLIMETDEGHPEYLRDYFKDHGNIVHDLKIHLIKEDFAGKSRFIVLQKVAKKEETTPTKEEAAEKI